MRCACLKSCWFAALLVVAALFTTPALGAPHAKGRSKVTKSRARALKASRPARLAAGELRVGVVGWSRDEKTLAVSSEKLMDPPRGQAAQAAEKTMTAKRKGRRHVDKLELMVSLYRCPGFEMHDSFPILDAARQGRRVRAAGWKRLQTQLGSEGFSVATLKTDPPALALSSSSAKHEATALSFRLSARLGIPAGATLELSGLEGNPVIALRQPAAPGSKGRRVVVQEFEAGGFELAESRCALQSSPGGRCLAVLCAEGGARPYLGVYLIQARRLKHAK